MERIGFFKKIVALAGNIDKPVGFYLFVEKMGYYPLMYDRAPEFD